MEPKTFELTPEQKGILATLSRATGKPVPALLDEALEGLRQREKQPVSTPSKKKHIWEIAAELFSEIPEEELAKLPVDGAAQHDHYIYGLPKRST